MITTVVLSLSGVAVFPVGVAVLAVLGVSVVLVLVLSVVILGFTVVVGGAGNQQESKDSSYCRK